MGITGAERERGGGRKREGGGEKRKRETNAQLNTLKGSTEYQTTVLQHDQQKFNIHKTLGLFLFRSVNQPSSLKRGAFYHLPGQRTPLAATT